MLKFFIACVLFQARPALGKSVPRPPPDPIALLDATLESPKASYQGRMIVVHWFGKRSRAEEVNVFYSPVNRYRWEFLSPGAESAPDNIFRGQLSSDNVSEGGGEANAHEIARIVISDGTREWVSLPHQHRALKGDAVKSGPKRIAPEAERELLLKNYNASVKGADKVVGRLVWVLELSPKIPSKFRERLWIDQETGVVLETRRFLFKRPFATLSRFSKFELVKNMPDELFQLAPDSMTKVDDHGLDPDFMSLESLNQALGKEMNFPQELPGGFVFESADFLPIQGTTIRYLRYTDGLTVLSLFQTDRPVQMPKTGVPKAASILPMPGTLEFSSSGKVLTWKSKQHRRYYTLIGEVSQEFLQQISAQLP